MDKKTRETLNIDKEHILVGLSSSPSNAKIVETAGKMAKAFNAEFTAIFVQTHDYEKLSEEDKLRYKHNVELAKKLGANIVTILGEDVPTQIAEYARLSKVTKIVMGRNSTKKKGLFNKPSIVDKLISISPNIDIHIIPDGDAQIRDQRGKVFVKTNVKSILKDILISILILIIVTSLGFLFSHLGFREANIITIYILGVLITSVFTNHKLCWGLSSVISVLVFNFLFTTPRFSFLAYGDGYPFTFLLMLIASIITGILASKMKNQVKQSSQGAYRTKILFDTNQLLQKATNEEDIIDITSLQLSKLLQRNILVFIANENKLLEPTKYLIDDKDFDIFDEEIEDANLVYKNNSQKNHLNNIQGTSRCVYYPISTRENIYGVISIYDEEMDLDDFENSIILSIVGECALAIENKQNENKKKTAELLAKNEKLKANLLRSISHDLRTPLTTISGNANNLLKKGDAFSDDAKKQIYSDIYEDSIWLTNIVENLLSVTSLDRGSANLNTSIELISEVVDEAIKVVKRSNISQKIIVNHEDDMALAKMDPHLIKQVIINILDNAIKYTPKTSTITINTKKENNSVLVEISDNGEGISDDAKSKVFDMFFRGTSEIADSRRSLGIGLALCKSIILAHNGEIKVLDNTPKGAKFVFSIPASEVNISE